MPRRSRSNAPAPTDPVEQETTMAEVTPEQEVMPPEITPPVESPDPVQAETTQQEITSEQAAVETSVSTPAEIQPEEIAASTMEVTAEPEGPRFPAMKATIKEGDMDNDLLATADVEVEGFGTFRNVRIKNGDYEPEVILPKTRLPVTGRWQEIFRFPSREMREQFNAAVLDAYHQELEMRPTEQTQEEEQLQDAPEYSDMDMTM